MMTHSVRVAAEAGRPSSRPRDAIPVSLSPSRSAAPLSPAGPGSAGEVARRMSGAEAARWNWRGASGREPASRSSCRQASDRYAWRRTSCGPGGWPGALSVRATVSAWSTGPKSWICRWEHSSGNGFKPWPDRAAPMSRRPAPAGLCGLPANHSDLRGHGAGNRCSRFAVRGRAVTAGGWRPPSPDCSGGRSPAPRCPPDPRPEGPAPAGRRFPSP